MNLPSVALPASPVPALSSAHFSATSASATPEQEISLFDHWRSLVRRKWFVLGATLLVAVLAYAVGLAMTPIFRSTATLLIEAGQGRIVSIQDPYADSMAGAQQREHFQTQVEIIQ